MQSGKKTITAAVIFTCTNHILRTSIYEAYKLYLHPRPFFYTLSQNSNSLSRSSAFPVNFDHITINRTTNTHIFAEPEYDHYGTRTRRVERPTKNRICISTLVCKILVHIANSCIRVQQPGSN